MKPPYSFSEPHLSPEVLRILGTEIQEHPRWADVGNRAGLMALVRGELDRALEHFETALEVNPNYGWAALNRALTLGLCGRAQEAVGALPEEQDPDRGAVALTRVVLALFAGDLAGGEAALASLPPDLVTRPDAQRLAAALGGLRSSEDGEAAWKRVVHHFASLPAEWSRPWDDRRLCAATFVPGLHQLYLEASNLEGRLGRWEAADSMASLARLHWADEAIYLNQRGLLAALAGRDEKAVKLYEEAARIAPDEPRAHIELAYLWSAAGDLDRAYGSLVNALARAPHYADLNYQMGLLHLAHESMKDALGSFQTALEINPDYAVARLQEAEALFTLHRWPEAAAAYERVVASGLESWEIRINQSQTLVRLSDLDGALESCRQAQRLAPSEPQVFYHLGRIHRLRGEREAAEAAWTEFLTLDGESDCRAEVERALSRDADDPS